ncbi:hypothetical protein QJQ45_010136 [Haematococcus lacustris]|nr:hypothetical protein QJQ45_010136 [Haematococcus lacustris]
MVAAVRGGYSVKTKHWAAACVPMPLCGATPAAVVVPPGAKQGVDDWALYLVLELCEGGSLLQALRTGRLWDHARQEPLWDAIVFILKDVVAGMAFLHSQNAVHRDLKPDNVLLQAAADHTVVAKEVWATGQFSKAGDVYSFGVLAWELLHGIDAWTRLQQITQEPRYLQGMEPHPLLFRHDWHPQPSAAATPQAQAAARGLRDLVDGCLQPQPSARPSFQDLEQYLTALVGWLGAG